MKLLTWLISISAIYKGHRIATTLLRSSGGPSAHAGDTSEDAFSYDELKPNKADIH